MKKNLLGDLLWAALLLIWVLILVVPATRDAFMGFSTEHAYAGGFIKFFILASMGDMLGARVLNGEWRIPKGFFWKAVVWGILGMMITLVFTVFMAGAAGAQAGGKLPWEGSQIAVAFFGSLIMNTTFGPMMYVYHKFGDMLVDMLIEKKEGTLQGKITIEAMVKRVDWQTLVGFSWVKSCLLIWTPCHTIVFLMAAEYRVLASAFLSILLGLLVASTKKASQNKLQTAA
ncbi:hypothetical protein [Anaerobium acetethylicum]|uniref:Mpv17 / PMP22 family protein n=1 Tax=Anaerobium acetethylicum TaxID=1619234 RepID=A0A1D3TTM7_9FIRM|nr:hypothetical protein [Anaerobium acetethylicum]SCP97348.1 hypothetical protein SAMN05421730_101015 [Anaerobium acetethylicum]